MPVSRLNQYVSSVLLVAVGGQQCLDIEVLSIIECRSAVTVFYSRVGALFKEHVNHLAVSA